MDESEAPAKAALTATSAAEPKPARTLRPLTMIWRQALQYPRQLMFALLALITTSAATLAIPALFKVIIDTAFGPGASIDEIATSFRYLLMIVAVLGLATALLPQQLLGKSDFFSSGHAGDAGASRANMIKNHGLHSILLECGDAVCIAVNTR